VNAQILKLSQLKKNYIPACNFCQTKYRTLGPAKSIAEIQWEK